MSSFKYAPAQIKCFVLVFETPDVGRQSGWVFMVFIFKSASVLVIPFLECITGETSVRVGVVVTVYDLSLVHHVINKAVADHGAGS